MNVIKVDTDTPEIIEQLDEQFAVATCVGPGKRGSDTRSVIAVLDSAPKSEMRDKINKIYKNGTKMV